MKRVGYSSTAAHQQLYQLVTVMQQHYVKSIRHLKRLDKKVRWRCTTLQEAIQIISQEGIKSPDVMANLMW